MSELNHENPIALSLDSLLSKGLDSVRPGVIKALERDDLSDALKLANDYYSKSGPEDLDAVLTYATLLNFRDLGSEALGVLKKASKHHADAPSLQLAQVEALMADEQYEAGVELMLALEELTFQEPRHIAYLGDLFLDVALDEHALRAYEQAMKQGLEDAGVALNAAQLMLEASRFDEGAETLERAARLAPRDYEIWSRAAFTWLGLEKWSKAIRAYRRVLKLQNGDASAWMYRGLAHANLGEFDEALDCYREAAHLEPDNPEHWLSIAHLELELGLPEEARKHYRKAEKLDPDEPEVASGLTAAAFELGDVEEAERMASRAVELDPGNPDSHYNLGIIELSLSRVDTAAKAFEAALELDPENRRYRMSMAAIKLRRGAIDEAVDMVGDVLDQAAEDATLLFEFCRDLVRFGGASRVDSFIEKSESHDPRWAAVRHLFEFLSLALRRTAEREAARHAVDSFVRVLRREPQIVPVMWDFEDIERLTLSLEDGDRETLETMLAVLEGRKEVDELDVQAA